VSREILKTEKRVETGYGRLKKGIASSVLTVQSILGSDGNPATKYEHPHQLFKLHPSAFINGYHSILLIH